MDEVGPPAASGNTVAAVCAAHPPHPKAPAARPLCHLIAGRLCHWRRQIYQPELRLHQLLVPRGQHDGLPRQHQGHFGLCPAAWREDSWRRQVGWGTHGRARVRASACSCVAFRLLTYVFPSSKYIVDRFEDFLNAHQARSREAGTDEVGAPGSSSSCGLDACRCSCCFAECLA